MIHVQLRFQRTRLAHGYCGGVDFTNLVLRYMQKDENQNSLTIVGRQKTQHLHGLYHRKFLIRRTELTRHRRTSDLKNIYSLSNLCAVTAGFTPLKSRRQMSHYTDN